MSVLDELNLKVSKEVPPLPSFLMTAKLRNVEKAVRRAVPELIWNYGEGIIPVLKGSKLSHFPKTF